MGELLAKNGQPIRCTQPMLTAAEIRWSMRSRVEQEIHDIFHDPNVIDTVAVRSEIVRPARRALPPSREPGEEG